MTTKDMTSSDAFYQELTKCMEKGEEMSIRQIYSLFPDTNPKTLSWRLYKLMQLGRLQRTAQGYYSLFSIDGHNAAGYGYMQKKSQTVYDIAIEHGYNFYITGLDSMVGEMLHIPEKYPVLTVVEDAGIDELNDALSDNGFLVITESSRKIINDTVIKNKIDVFLMKGKDFSQSLDHIAQKEKGFVDLYYAVTRMEYAVPVPELSRIYQNLKRNQSLAPLKVKKAAKDRGITTEINWLIDLAKTTDRAKEFMGYQIKEVL